MKTQVKVIPVPMTKYAQLIIVELVAKSIILKVQGLLGFTEFEEYS